VAEGEGKRERRTFLEGEGIVVVGSEVVLKRT